MLYYLILFSRAPSTQKEIRLGIEVRQKVREQHLARCKALQGEERLLVGGPFPSTDVEDPDLWFRTDGYSGGMIIARFQSLKEAESWAMADPYVTSGFFGGPIVVKPWYQTIGSGVEFGRAW